jgi:hypothetical protein
MSEALADEIQRLVLMVRERDSEINRLRAERDEALAALEAASEVLKANWTLAADVRTLMNALAAEQATVRALAGIITTHAAAMARGDDLRALTLFCESARGHVVSRRALLDAADDVEEALKLRCIAMTAASKAARGAR